jgi:hypothetical protein
MPTFGEDSRKKLATCHPLIQEVMYEAIHGFDFKVLVGFRGKAEQEAAFLNGKSTKRWPESKHNVRPSLGIDVAPWYPGEPHIRWRKTGRFIYLAGWIQRTANVQGVMLRWGGDWDMDTELADQQFNDLGHFELMLP